MNYKKSLLLFKWPSDRRYQERLSRVLSLPVGARGEIYYNKKWISDEISSGDNLKIKTVFMIASVKHTIQNGKHSYQFLYAIPCRLLEVRKIRVEHEEDYYFEFIAGDFFKNINEKYDEKRIKQEFQIKSLPGQEKGYAHLVELQPSFLKTNGLIPLNEIFNILSEIPRSRDSDIAIKDYPLIRISSVNAGDKTIEPDSEGIFNLIIGQIYKIKGEFYQGDKDKEREFSINEGKYLGRRESFEIEVVKDKLSADVREETIDLKVKFSHPFPCEFTIILSGLFKRKWWQKYIWPFTILLSCIAMGIVWHIEGKFPSELFSALIIFYLTNLLLGRK